LSIEGELSIGMEDVEPSKVLGDFRFLDVALMAIGVNFFDMVYILIISELHFDVDPVVELVLAI
jgi:hypothetical protein